MRYDNCVTFVMDVPDELYDYTIPKLTFQPIVEKCIPARHHDNGTEKRQYPAHRMEVRG